MQMVSSKQLQLQHMMNILYAVHMTNGKYVKGFMFNALLVEQVINN